MTLPDIGAQQWTAIYNMLKAEMTPSGRLSTLGDLRKSLHLWTDVMPAAGVQLVELSESDWATRKHIVKTTFHIIAATQSLPVTNGNTTTPANLDAALAALQPIVSDGNGNGITAILRDPNNYGLNGLAIRTGVSGVKYFQDLGGGNTPQVYAYALITFEAEVPVSI